MAEPRAGTGEGRPTSSTVVLSMPIVRTSSASRPSVVATTCSSGQLTRWAITAGVSGS